MGRPRVYPDEFRERAVRLVGSGGKPGMLPEGGLTVISEQLGLRRETLRRSVMEQEVDQGTRPGPSTDERSRITELERENRSCAGPMRSRAQRLSSGRSYRRPKK